MSSSEPAPRGDDGLNLHVEGSISAAVEEVWSALFDPGAMARWLRPRPSMPREAPEPDASASAATDPSPFGTPSAGSILVLEPRRHVRLSWRPEGWPAPTVLHACAQASRDGGTTRVSFHQEGLPGGTEREERRAVLEEALDDLRRTLERS